MEAMTTVLEVLLFSALGAGVSGVGLGVIIGVWWLLRRLACVRRLEARMGWQIGEPGG